MSEKRIKLSKLSLEEIDDIMNKHRVRILAKYINENYLNNEKFKYKATNELELVINNELIKGLDKEFCVIEDDPNDPLIKELINQKTLEIIKEIYK